MEIIEVNLCAICGLREVKSPRKKYCSEECAKVAQRQQQAAHMERKRNNEDVESSVENSTIQDLALLQPERDKIAVIFRDFLEPVFFGISTHLADISEQQRLLDIKIDELQYIQSQDPEVQQRLTFHNRALKKAIKLMKDFGEMMPPHRIRQHFQWEMGITDKKYAEEILREAVDRIRRGKDDKQSSMEDYT